VGFHTCCTAHERIEEWMSAILRMPGHLAKPVASVELMTIAAGVVQTRGTNISGVKRHLMQASHGYRLWPAPSGEVAEAVSGDRASGTCLSSSAGEQSVRSHLRSLTREFPGDSLEPCTGAQSCRLVPGHRSGASELLFWNNAWEKEPLRVRGVLLHRDGGEFQAGTKAIMKLLSAIAVTLWALATTQAVAGMSPRGFHGGHTHFNRWVVITARMAAYVRCLHWSAGVWPWYYPPPYYPAPVYTTRHRQSFTTIRR
jgi:hypothetical protein